MHERSVIPDLLYHPEPSGAVLNQHEFARDFAFEASKARFEIGTDVMLWEADQQGQTMADIFRNHVPADVRKLVFYDWYSEAVFQGKSYALYSKIPGMKASMDELAQRHRDFTSSLEKAGTRVTVLNKPQGNGIKDTIIRFFPLFGREHIKGSWVDDRVFYIQTANYSDDNAERYIDTNVKVTGPAAKKLIEVFKSLKENPPQEDQAGIKISEDMHVYYDAGIPGKSAILDKAIGLVQNAKKKVSVCSYFLPDGEFARELETAYKRGVLVEVITGIQPLELGDPLNVENIFWVINKLLEISSSLHKYSFPLYVDPYRHMHSKLLIADREALIGSHNLNKQGVRAGTEEFQVLTANPAIVSNLERKFRDLKTVATMPQLLSVFDISQPS